MGRVIIFALVVVMVVRESYSSCPPMKDSPRARLIYTSGNTVQVRPTSPLEEGTVATLSCHSELTINGRTNATCESGQWVGLPLGECAEE
ncbi:hypothetical protein COOONC_20502 [Cooperia oncophora]